MFRALVLFTFGGGALACASAPPSAPRALARPSVPVARASAEPAGALAKGCRAEPSTVYGNEPVVFEVQGPIQTGTVALQLRDARGQAVLQDRAPVPGHWQAALPESQSGDFRLEVGSNGVHCFVTVNRELARASAAP